MGEMTNIETNVANMDSSIANLSGEMTNIKTDVTKMNSSMDTLGSDLTNLKVDLGEVKEEVASNSELIHNIPPATEPTETVAPNAPTETPAPNEATEEVVIVTGTSTAPPE